jgi:hypothetical protein
MKKIAIAVTMSLISTLTFGQVDSVYVVRHTDNMSGKIYTYSSKGDFICHNETRTIGFKVLPILDDNLLFEKLYVTMFGIGGCNEKDEIIILCENGEKIIKKSVNKFNCKGEAYFNLSDSDIRLLKTQPMSKIRMTNGRTYESFTGDVKDKDKRYFIQLLYAIENKVVVERNK